MGYHTGNYTITAFIAELVGDLVATDDFVLVDNQAASDRWQDGYCIRYIPDDLYITIAKTGGTSTSTAMMTPYSTSYMTSAYYYTGITVLVSTGYDISTHYPTGTIYAGAAPLFGGIYNDSVTNINLIGDTVSFPITYYADRFGVVAAIENPNQTQAYRHGLYITLEFIPAAARLYNDGLSSIFYHCKVGGNHHGATVWSRNDPIPQSHLNLRPFTRYQNAPLVNVFGAMKAYRSVGAGRAFFEFPLFHNTSAVEMPTLDTEYTIPIHRTRRWFLATPLGNLAAGDEVVWTDNTDPGSPVDRTFILCNYSSTLYSDNLYIAVPKTNAYQYTSGD